MYLGLDIGSSSSKAVLLGENQESLAAQVVNLGTGTKGVGQVLEAVYRQAGIGPEEVRYTVVTGYGRLLNDTKTCHFDHCFFCKGSILLIKFFI